MYKANEIAKWFICNIDRDSGSSITHLKLQKLLYYAQAWYLVLSETNEPLFSEKIEAWTHGPVVREVYNDYSDKGYNSLEFPDDCPELNNDSIEILNDVMETYGKYDAKYLEALTHQEEPWIKTRGNLPLEARCEKEITLDLIKNFYQKMYDANE